MIFYLGLNFIFAFLSIIEINNLKKRTSIFFFSGCVIVLFFLSWIRWETGTDWDSYLGQYNWIHRLWDTMDNGMESGYNAVLNVGKLFFESYTGVLFLFAIIIYGNMLYSYPKLTSYPMTALWLTFCISFANMLFVRQNVALTILTVALIPAWKRDFRVFVLMVFFASLFHRTSWVFLLIYPLFNRVYTTKQIIVAVLLCLIIGSILSHFILSQFGLLFPDIIARRITSYLEAGSEDNSMSYSTTIVLIKGFINRSILLFLFLMSLPSEQRRRNKLINGLFNIYILGTILYCVLLPLSISLARVAVYMDITQVFLIGYILCRQKGLINRLLLFGIILIYYTVRLYSYIMAYESEFVPYNTIFS